MSTAGDELFPVEIWIQILIRVPLKPLAAAQSTCKFFRRLITSPYFTQSYNHFSSFNHPMILFEPPPAVPGAASLVCADPSSSLTPLSLAFLNDRVRVRASSNGLLFCSSVPATGRFYVCNPVARQFTVINRSPSFWPTMSRDDPLLVGLAADPGRSRVRVVLAGYHRPFGCQPNNPLIGHVFDSDTNSWTRIQTVSYDDFGYMNKNQVVYLHGCLHWLTQRCSHILVLDLEHEVWSKILLKDEIGVVGARNYLLELDGCLSVVQILEESMVIWVNKDCDGELEWIAVDKINLSCIGGRLSSTFPISQNSSFVFLATHKCVLMYDRRCRKWRAVYSLGKNIGCPLWFNAFPFRSMIFPL